MHLPRGKQNKAQQERATVGTTAPSLTNRHNLASSLADHNHVTFSRALRHSLKNEAITRHYRAELITTPISLLSHKLHPDQNTKSPHRS